MAIALRNLSARVCIGFLSLPWILCAQPADNLSQEVHIQFCVYTLGGTEELCYFPAKGHSAKSLHFYSSYASPNYDYKGPAHLEFFSQRLDREHKAPVANYDIPKKTEQLLLLFLPTPTPSNDGFLYKIYGVDNRKDSQKPDSFHIINFSGHTYMAQLGAARIEIPEGIGPSYPAKGRVALHLATQVDKLWINAGKYEFTLNPTERALLLLYPPASKTAIYPLIRCFKNIFPVANN